MPSEERNRCALDAVRSRMTCFIPPWLLTSDQVRGLLAGTGNVAEDQSVALGNFAQGRVNVIALPFRSQGRAHRHRRQRRRFAPPRKS